MKLIDEEFEINQPRRLSIRIKLFKKSVPLLILKCEVL